MCRFIFVLFVLPIVSCGSVPVERNLTYDEICLEEISQIPYPKRFASYSYTFSYGIAFNFGDMHEEINYREMFERTGNDFHDIYRTEVSRGFMPIIWIGEQASHSFLNITVGKVVDSELLCVTYIMDSRLNPDRVRL